MGGGYKNWLRKSPNWKEGDPVENSTINSSIPVMVTGRDSRIDATAVCAPRIARITQNYDWEQYAVNLLTV